ncbi:glycosyltransferase [Aestuariibaculum lutulentum]|uniref:Glycosyltransferase n=1 Tax=Aestuariibaculum lutulentum TaxID=2920935 RepID=A0ABS9RGN5_9FLAO|nr:glycosyltransferase [Aestuariibaculum lutulentum]MCH4552106.1 glycosyltransferase [Aestuariibaculum lutulentum]
MKTNKIDFSIITICYNSVNTVEKTIKSVISQSHENYEYIIIDGGSKDGTLEIINKYKGKISLIISEPDDGIYDAFNKGVKLAKGNHIGILNSDDTYNYNTLELAFKSIKKKPLAIIYGNTCFIDENDVVFSQNDGDFGNSKLKRGIGFMHPASFVPMEVYNKVGLYSVSKNLFIASDADFLLRCYKFGIEFYKSDFKVFMRTGGLSETSFYLAHKQYLNSLFDNGIIDKKELFIEKNKLLFKSILKRFLTRKNVAKIKLQIWIVIVSIFNFLIRYIPFNFFKRKLLKISGISLGSNSYIHNSTFLSLGKLSVGDFTVINPKCIIDNRGEIKIGSNVSIAHYCKIYTTGHDVNCSYFTGIKKAVVIEDNVVLFSNCIIQPGVTLGKGCVVFPGSVVTKDVPPFTMVGGNPAKLIGQRNKNLNYRIDYGFRFIK